MVPFLLRAVIGAGCLIAQSMPGAPAETARELYSKNKTRMVNGVGPGGGGDTYARLVALQAAWL
ncbi:MAG: hypothetical protein OEO83_04810 [Alphaproteobacteria bacterium]|nr:hypothetical protein [Alphaproteobacteria bacterium]